MATEIDIVLNPNVAGGCFVESSVRIVTISAASCNRDFFPVSSRGDVEVLAGRENRKEHLAVGETHLK